MPFETSSIRFEMCMPPLDNSYPYYYSFPMMKPFTSLSEVSTKFSMPSQTLNNHKSKQSNTINKNNDKTNNTNNKKSHWDNFQYNNTQNNDFRLFNSFVPSDKYFDSLKKELNNYLSVTNLNITNLKNLYIENLNKIELLLQTGLSENYEIKFGHYGSFFSDLSIEGSDLDILIYYHKKKEECDFDKDILSLLLQNENEFESIYPILTASVPVIKLEINIKNEIKDLKLKTTSYFEEEDLFKIKIDLTFTESEQEFQNSHETVSFINKSLSEYPQIKPMVLLLKRYFKEMKMNKSYTGGLCSYSLFLLVLSFCKCNKQCESSTKLLYYFMENFMYFDYCNYCIDVEKENCYVLKDKNESLAEKSVSDENSSYETNYESCEKEEICIVDPISKNNVSKSSFKVDEIILTFRKAFNLLYYEGWYYDFVSTNNNNENRIVEDASEFYEDSSSDYMTIKKLFRLKSLRNNFDFFFN
jgi:DNA polymerase sigma